MKSLESFLGAQIGSIGFCRSQKSTKVPGEPFRGLRRVTYGPGEARGVCFSFLWVWGQGFYLMDPTDPGGILSYQPLIKSVVVVAVLC